MIIARGEKQPSKTSFCILNEGPVALELYCGLVDCINARIAASRINPLELIRLLNY